MRDTLPEQVAKLSDRELQENLLLEMVAIREIMVEEHLMRYHRPSPWAWLVTALRGNKH